MCGPDDRFFSSAQRCYAILELSACDAFRACEETVLRCMCSVCGCTLYMKWHSEPPFIGCLSIRQEILNVSQIAVTLHRIRPQFVTQTGLHQHRTNPFFSLCALLFRQSHLFLICVVLTYHDSRIIPRKTCQIPRNCQCK